MTRNWDVWNSYVLLYIRASRKVIEKRSTDFNGLEDNGTLLFKTATCWIVVYIHKNINSLKTNLNKFVWKSENIFNSSKFRRKILSFDIFPQLLASIEIYSNTLYLLWLAEFLRTLLQHGLNCRADSNAKPTVLTYTCK